MDLIGTIILPGLLLITGTGFIFGWAKPVPVDSSNFKNPRKNMAIVALAGPMSNLFMAIGWALIARIGVTLGVDNETIAMPLIYSGIAGISINLILMLLNLLPIPPLDGSRILSGMLPSYWAWQFNKLERFGFIILLAMLYFNVLSVVLAYPKYILEQWFLPWRAYESHFIRCKH